MKVLKSTHFNSPKTVNLTGIADTVKGSAGEPTDAAVRREAAEAEEADPGTHERRHVPEPFSEGFAEALRDLVPLLAKAQAECGPSAEERRRRELYDFACCYAHAGYNPRDAVSASLELLGRLETELAAQEAAHPTEPPSAGEERQEPDQDQG
jgi:hypothetical protein